MTGSGPAASRIFWGTNLVFDDPMPATPIANLAMSAFERLREAFQIVLVDANKTATRAINVRYQREGDGHDKR